MGKATKANLPALMKHLREARLREERGKREPLLTRLQIALYQEIKRSPENVSKNKILQ